MLVMKDRVLATRVSRTEMARTPFCGSGCNGRFGDPAPSDVRLGWITPLKWNSNGTEARWNQITYDRVGSMWTVAAMIRLAEGHGQLRYLESGPSFIIAHTFGGQREQIVYRLRDNAILSTGLLNQPPRAALVLAAALMSGATARWKGQPLSSGALQLQAAHLALLRGLATNRPQPELDRLAIAAGAVLLEVLEANEPQWYEPVHPDRIPELDDLSAVSLDRLFSDLGLFGDFLAGKETPFAVLDADGAPETPATSLHRVPKPRDFTGSILRQPAIFEASEQRWDAIDYDRVPSVLAVRAMIRLAEGRGGWLRYLAEPGAFIASFPFGGISEDLVYRPLEHVIVSTGVLYQSPNAALLMAAALLTMPEPPVATQRLAQAHLALLRGLAADRPQSELDQLAIAAGEALRAAMDADFDPANLDWYVGAELNTPGQIDEATNPAAKAIGDLFSDPVIFAAFLAGKLSPFDALRDR